MRPACYRYHMAIFILALFSLALSARAVTLGEASAVPVSGSFTTPLWSPDGSGLAVSGEGFNGLYMIDMSGNIRTVSDSPLSGWGFKWSPDGRNLAYRQRDKNGTSLVVTGPDGKAKVVAPQIDTKSPISWDKNGLTFRSGDEMVTLDDAGNVKHIESLSRGQGLLSRLMNISGFMLTNQITGATFTALPASAVSSTSKTNQGPYIDYESQIWITDKDGNKRKLIDVEGVQGYSNPVESPNEDRYAVQGYDGNIYMADLEGGQPLNIGKGSNARWSPDGRFVIYERNEDDGYRIISSDLWVSSADGKLQFRLTETQGAEMYPSWSPDGRSIAYVVDGAVYIAPIDTQR